uniref:Wsv206-like protein n=1 Tax=Metapenaeus joyneri majanivirus TaxID=2984280 RepID=A0A9C7BWD8_9VIRU|nr:MAG: wsv206-like protein [Metapenaeus joyneri majanivirus]
MNSSNCMDNNNTIHIIGDITKLEKYPNYIIVQQLNCIATKSHGLSLQMASVYPYGDVYNMRKSIGNRNCAELNDRPVPGTITLHKNTNNRSQSPIICNLYGQYCYNKNDHPIFQRLIEYLYNKKKKGGKLNTADQSQLDYMLKDNKKQRYQWFLKGLNNLSSVLRGEEGGGLNNLSSVLRGEEEEGGGLGEEEGGGLNNIKSINNIFPSLDQRDIDQCDTVVFPYKIGCGLAGGNWNDYISAISKFSDEISKYGKKVIIMQLSTSGYN